MQKNIRESIFLKKLCYLNIFCVMIMLHDNIFRIIYILKKLNVKRERGDDLKEEFLWKVSLESLKMRSNICFIITSFSIFFRSHLLLQ